MSGVVKAAQDGPVVMETRGGNELTPAVAASELVWDNRGQPETQLEQVFQVMDGQGEPRPPWVWVSLCGSQTSPVLSGFLDADIWFSHQLRAKHQLDENTVAERASVLRQSSEKSSLRRKNTTKGGSRRSSSLVCTHNYTGRGNHGHSGRRLAC